MDEPGPIDGAKESLRGHERRDVADPEKDKRKELVFVAPAPRKRAAGAGGGDQGMLRASRRKDGLDSRYAGILRMQQVAGNTAVTGFLADDRTTLRRTEAPATGSTTGADAVSGVASAAVMPVAAKSDPVSSGDSPTGAASGSSSGVAPGGSGSDDSGASRQSPRGGTVGPSTETGGQPAGDSHHNPSAAIRRRRPALLLRAVPHLDLLTMQRTVGNAAVCDMLDGAQPTGSVEMRQAATKLPFAAARLPRYEGPDAGRSALASVRRQPQNESAVQRLGEQTDSELMWRQLKETLTSPREMFSYTLLGWSKSDWRNAGKALMGYAEGVGQVFAAPGVLTYYATGSLLYRSDPTFYSHYKEHDVAFSGIIASLRNAFATPASAAHAFADGFTSQLDKSRAALMKGDAAGAGAGMGNFTMSVLMVAEGSQGGQIDLVLEPSQSAVAMAGLRLVITAPKNALPAGVLLMANNATQDGSESQGGDKAKPEGNGEPELAKPQTPSSPAPTYSWRGRKDAMDVPAVQIGHRTSHWTEGPSFFAIEDADFNQLTGQGPERGGKYTIKESVLISGSVPSTGVWVDYESALRWSSKETSKLTRLSRELVENAPRGQGWAAPPGISDEAAMQRFGKEQLSRIASDPSHPMRFLIESPIPK